MKTHIIVVLLLRCTSGGKTESVEISFKSRCHDNDIQDAYSLIRPLYRLGWSEKNFDRSGRGWVGLQTSSRTGGSGNEIFGNVGTGDEFILCHIAAL